ncbi:hypothetical protein F4823DRAFT_191123 [Ustulina deusta]|nr:hypothetical protein F4823DRAFT_191123 [Ustulina deusta]
MTTLSIQEAEMPMQVAADVDQQTSNRIPPTTFHLFPELPAELRIEIWDAASKTIPLQIHLHLVEYEHYGYYYSHEYSDDDNPDEAPVVDSEIRYPAVLWKNMKYQKARMKTILPVLHTNCESRKIAFERYSIVPLDDFFIIPWSPTDLVPKNLCPVEWRGTNLAIDWREDTVFWSPDCPHPSPDLPWAKRLCNATKLCIPMDDNLTFYVDCGILDPRQDTDKTIQIWTEFFLPIFSKLEEITFVIIDGIEIGECMGFSDEGAESLLKAPRWTDSLFTPWPNCSVLGSKIDGGCLVLNKYPLGPLIGRVAEGEKPYWWQGLLLDSLDSVRMFQSEIGRERPGMKLHLGLESKMIKDWKKKKYVSDALEELKSYPAGFMIP